MTHAIDSIFALFSAPLTAPLHWVASCTESTVQPRDGGTDFTYVLQGHSTQRSCYTHLGTCGSETARSGVLDVHVHRAWRDRAHPVHVQQAKETVAVGAQ